MNRADTLGRGPLALPGYPFVLIAGGLTLACFFLAWTRLALLGLAATVFLVYFFRNPERAVPADAMAIVAPADGKVIIVDEVADDDVGLAKRVAIFMNVFDVHVNRAPATGNVVSTEHHRGRFLAAFREEADKANERQVTILATDTGERLKVIQIAGLLARRIIASVKPGDRLELGQRIGMICFGSRVDLYLPPECVIMVQKGDRVKAGSSSVARWA